VPYHFDIAAVARFFFLDYHNPEKRLLLGAESRQSNH
jgi:hypothetical protein